MRSSSSSRTGFSLIEAIVAIVILSLAVPAMFWAIRDAAGRRAEPVMLSRARWLAAEKIEDILADRYCPSRGFTFIQTPAYPAEASVDGFPGFARQVVISERGADLESVGTGYKVATVRVTYPGAAGSSRSLEMAVVVTEY